MKDIRLTTAVVVVATAVVTVEVVEIVLIGVLGGQNREDTKFQQSVRCCVTIALDLL
jgi:hypothetical protein